MKTFEDYLMQFHTPQTVASYVRSVNKFLFHCTAKDQSTYVDIVNYLSDFSIRSPKDISGIKKYFDFLIDTNKRSDHPCKMIVLGRSRNQSVQFQDLFSSNELELLLERSTRYGDLVLRNKVIISLLIYQGLSSANIVNLKLKDLDMDQGTVYIKSTPKLARRTLELKAKQIPMLFKYIYEDRPKLLKQASEKLFITKIGNPLSVDSLHAMIEPLKPLFPAKNLHLVAIRKSVITNWLGEQKIPLEDVQLLAGQKWLTTTEKYIRANSEQKRELINRFFPI